MNSSVSFIKSTIFVVVAENYSEHDDHQSMSDDMDGVKDDTAKSNMFSAGIITDELNGEPEIGCSECNLFFRTTTAYESHVSSAHSTVPTSNAVKKSEKSFECPECHKCFAEKKILNRHLKIHNPIKSHVCNICHMTFAESSNLTKHMKKHTGELRNVVGKPNLCSACGKGFKWASSLSKHMKHHTGHRILTCSYCPKYYVEARSLNIHMRSHTGEKPFQCDICNKAFTQMGNLEKHLRVSIRTVARIRFQLTHTRSFESGPYGRASVQMPNMREGLLAEWIRGDSFTVCMLTMTTCTLHNHFGGVNSILVLIILQDTYGRASVCVRVRETLCWLKYVGHS